MELKRVRRYRRPGYPVKEFYSSRPELLLGHAPSRWLKKGAAAGALLAFVGFGVSCKGTVKTTRVKVKRVSLQDEHRERRGIGIDGKVAPLFIHGEGSGAIGCVVMTPPVFLSEAEALDLILSELKKAGITCSQTDYVVENFFTEERYGKLDEKFNPQGYEVGAKHPLCLDAYDSVHHLGIAYISGENYHRLGGVLSPSTVQVFNLVDLAQEIREKLKGRTPLNAVFFYDPMEKWHSGSSGDAPKERSKELLQQQVQDFIRWFQVEFPEGIKRT